uniref:SH3 and multiple ankyrin repeat domains 3 n=1 Tax=Pan paniscus TaxID=9597 RepID=A0A2R8ZVC4_PANPA
MKKFASSRSLNKILAQCDSSSREYEEIQAVERKWHLHLATPRRLLLDRRSKASLFFAAPPPPKRAPSTTLTLRSKSMTAELEELEKLDEMLAAAAEPTLRPDIADADSRAATVKQRPTSRRITPAEISSLFERQGLPGPEKLPGSLRKGIPRTKSVGMAGLWGCMGWGGTGLGYGWAVGLHGVGRNGAGAGRADLGLKDTASPCP